MSAARLRRSLDHARRLMLLRRVFAAGLGPRGWGNLLRFSRLRFLSGRRIPVSVMIAVTYKCQCDCVHCAVSSAATGREEMSTADVLNLIDDARAVGAIKIGFTGGEPLLRRDLPVLVRRARAQGLSNSIDTNGERLDAAAARELKSAGLTNVNVSLDRPDARRHDRLRRRAGSFAAAVLAVESCAAAGLPCVVSTYVTDRALEDGSLAELIRLSRSLGADAVRVLFPIYSGKFEGRRRPLLSPENRRAFFEKYVDPSFVYSESPFYDFLSGRMECSMMRRLSVYVTPYGDVKPCYVSLRPLGNVREARLPRILADRRYTEAPLPGEIACGLC